MNIVQVEDSATDAELIREVILRSGMQATFHQVQDAAAYVTALREVRPQLILCDHSLPAFDSMTALRLLKEEGVSIPFILVTGTVSEEFAVAIMRAGAWDYLLKDRMHRLPQAVLQALERKQLEDERALHLRQLADQEKLLRSASRLARLASFRIDLRNNVYLWSHEWFRLLGLPATGTVASFDDFKHLVHPADVPLVEKKLAQVIEEAVPQRFIFRMINERGEKIYLRSELAVERDHNNEKQYLVGFFQDISQERKLEQKIRKQKLAVQRRLARAVISAEENERARIGREIHDNVNQILSSAHLYLCSLQSEVNDKAEAFEHIAELVKMAIQENRGLSYSLTAHALNEFGLESALHELTTSVQAASGLAVNLMYEKNAEEYISREVQIGVYRIAQEQITNVLRHAAATEIGIHLRKTSDGVQLCIADNGKGFDTTQKKKGIGLKNIQARAECCGGHMHIDSAPGKGTVLTVFFPQGA